MPKYNERSNELLYGCVKVGDGEEVCPIMDIFTYAVTVRKTRGVVTRSHYEGYLSWLSQRGIIGNVNYESTRGLHVHFLIDAWQRLDKRDFLYEPRGWSIRHVPIWDRKGWVKYCEKDKPKFIDDDPPSPSPVPTHNLFKNV